MIRIYEEFEMSKSHYLKIFDEITSNYHLLMMVTTK